MSLGSDISGQIPFWRQEAESLMVDTATITPPTGGAAIYDGPCRVLPATPGGQLEYIEAGSSDFRRVSFPYDTDAPAGYIVTITESDDDAQVDMKFRIVAGSPQSYVMYREYWCEVIA